MARILGVDIPNDKTIEIALKAAETGHMVFSTVHTTDVAKTIGRIVGVFPAEEQPAVRSRLAENVKGIVSQRLAPKANGKGRVVAAEILVATSTIRDAIANPKTRELMDRIEFEHGGPDYDEMISVEGPNLGSLNRSVSRFGRYEIRE